MKTLFLIRGISGAGKSTTANLLSENGKYPVLSADMYFEDSEGRYNWDGSKIKDAHAWCKTQVERLMKHHEVDFYSYIDIENDSKLFGRFGNYKRQLEKIFVANTFTQEWEIEDYFTLAEKYGYQIVSLIVENRHGNKNVHNVPEETMVKMKERFQIKL